MDTWRATAFARVGQDFLTLEIFAHHRLGKSTNHVNKKEISIHSMAWTIPDKYNNELSMADNRVVMVTHSIHDSMARTNRISRHTIGSSNGTLDMYM